MTRGSPRRGIEGLIGSPGGLRTGPVACCLPRAARRSASRSAAARSSGRSVEKLSSASASAASTSCRRRSTHSRPFAVATWSTARRSSGSGLRSTIPASTMPSTARLTVGSPSPMRAASVPRRRGPDETSSISTTRCVEVSAGPSSGRRRCARGARTAPRARSRAPQPPFLASRKDYIHQGKREGRRGAPRAVNVRRSAGSVSRPSGLPAEAGRTAAPRRAGPSPRR